MSVDMTIWQEKAKQNVHNRPAGEGRLAGKVTIVTGAAQGFGKGIAEELYKEGATVVIADMNQPLAESVAAQMGERACAIPVNVSDEESVANLVAQTVDKFGGLDIMLANAGVVRSGPLATFEKKDMEFVTAINYTGLFLCAKYAAMIMQAQHEADPEGYYDIISICRQQVRRHRSGAELGAGAVRIQYQGQCGLSRQLPGWSPVVRSCKRPVCPVFGSR